MLPIVRQTSEELKLIHIGCELSCLEMAEEGPSQIFLSVNIKIYKKLKNQSENFWNCSIGMVELAS